MREKAAAVILLQAAHALLDRPQGSRGPRQQPQRRSHSSAAYVRLAGATSIHLPVEPLAPGRPSLRLFMAAVLEAVHVAPMDSPSLRQHGNDRHSFAGLLAAGEAAKACCWASYVPSTFTLLVYVSVSYRRRIVLFRVLLLQKKVNLNRYLKSTIPKWTILWLYSSQTPRLYSSHSCSIDFHQSQIGHHTNMFIKTTHPHLTPPNLEWRAFTWSRKSTAAST